MVALLFVGFMMFIFLTVELNQREQNPHN